MIPVKTTKLCLDVSWKMIFYCLHLCRTVDLFDSVHGGECPQWPKGERKNEDGRKKKLRNKSIAEPRQRAARCPSPYGQTASIQHGGLRVHIYGGFDPCCTLCVCVCVAQGQSGDYAAVKWMWGDYDLWLFESRILKAYNNGEYRQSTWLLCSNVALMWPLWFSTCKNTVVNTEVV